ncbi:GTPase [Acinetobacter guerrae]|uniref:GTPase n=1 Tax=Acinetobacter guerrae TaxID=1843371 RepID=UPI0030C8A6BE
MDMQNFEGAVNAILAVLPNRETDLARLVRLITAAAYPTITVIGKYNHGKSRLLNELIGHDIFSVADKRETIHLAEHIHQNISWLDAPGLDADVAAVDDDYAFNAIWTQADIRLFVHSIREGELDAIEHQLLQQLVSDFQTSQRQTLLVLTQLDQMPDQQVLAHIQQSIRDQIPDLDALSVSATRHRQGVENSKPLLVEKSGIVGLQQAIELAISQVPNARRHEKNQLFSGMQQQLTQLQTELAQTQQKLQHIQQQQRQDFDERLIKILDKIREDLHRFWILQVRMMHLYPIHLPPCLKIPQVNSNAPKSRLPIRVPVLILIVILFVMVWWDCLKISKRMSKVWIPSSLLSLVFQ